MLTTRLFRTMGTEWFTLFLAVVLSLFCWPAMSDTKQSSGSRQPESCFFFPYESCILLRVQKIEHENDPYSSNTRLVTGYIEDVLHGSLKPQTKVRLELHSRLEEVFKQANENNLLGTQQLLAFRQYSFWKECNRLPVDNVFVPFEGSNASIADVTDFRKKLQKTPFPYRSCLVVKVKEVNVKNREECSVIMQIDSVVVEDRRFESEGIKGISPEEAFKRFGVSPIDHFDFKPQQTIRVDFELNESLELPREHARYILLWNPCHQLFSKIANAFEDASLQFAAYRPRRIEQIKDHANLNDEKLVSLRRQLESHIQSRWSPNRIREYLKRPELRDCPPLQSVRVADGPVLGGQLYGDSETELGKVIWYAALRRMQPIDEFQITVTSKEGWVWRLQDGPFSLNEFTDENFIQDILSLTVQRAFSSYWMVFNYRLLRDPRAKPDFSVASFPEPISDRPVLIRDAKRQIIGARFRLIKGKVLTADVDSDLHLTNIRVDGKPSLPWTTAYEDRVTNMDKIWNHILSNR